MRRAGCLLLFVSFSIPVVLADEGGDKSGYTLFRPTPEALLRELTSDRPDKTESPITVDAGHFQLEMAA
jgi:hypothetical protein